MAYGKALKRRIWSRCSIKKGRSFMNVTNKHHGQSYLRIQKRKHQLCALLQVHPANSSISLVKSISGTTSVSFPVNPQHHSTPNTNIYINQDQADPTTLHRQPTCLILLSPRHLELNLLNPAHPKPQTLIPSLSKQPQTISPSPIPLNQLNSPIHPPPHSKETKHIDPRHLLFQYPHLGRVSCSTKSEAPLRLNLCID